MPTRYLPRPTAMVEAALLRRYARPKMLFEEVGGILLALERVKSPAALPSRHPWLHSPFAALAFNCGGCADLT